MLLFLTFVAFFVFANAAITTLLETNYDAAFTRHCDASSVLYRIRSYHNNQLEDRRWTYGCKSGYPLTNPSWSGYLNNFDQPVNYKCGANRVLTGMHSYHDNKSEDRRWRAQCSTLRKALGTVDCVWTNYVNAWDAAMDWTVPSKRVITGVFSHHYNAKEDRIWKFYHCATIIISVLYSTLPQTGYDASFSRACGASSVLFRIKSHHDNQREDRQWTYSCKSGFTLIKHTSTGYLNDWYKPIYYQCGVNQVLTGLNSLHDNGKEDRRWEARCSTLGNARRTVNCVWTAFINSWDGPIDWTVPRCYNRVITGLHSGYNNGRGDRLWRFYHCSTTD